MKRESAETLAIQVLAWLVGNEDLLPIFLGSTGMAPEDLGNRASEAEFLGSVLDFLMLDDSWIVAFCDSAQLDYAEPLRARRQLPGGAAPDWT